MHEVCSIRPPGICSGPTVVGSPSQILKKANHENSAGPSEQTPEAPMRILEDSGEIGVISTGCLAVTAGCQGRLWKAAYAMVRWDESRDLYGLKYGSGLNQDLGGVVLRAGRCVSFPNVYQHKIEPFQLIEGQPAGHVHLLSLSLVHPNHKLVSTSEVPPQQLEWLKEAIFADPDSRLSKLPSGLAELIGRTLDEISEFPISAGTEMRNSIDMNEERIYKGVNLNTTHDEKRLHGN
eukprot:gene5026-34811_t